MKKIVFMADDTVVKRLDALLERDDVRAVAPNRTVLLRMAVASYLTSLEADDPVAVPAAVPAARKPAAPAAKRTPKPYEPGPGR